jgi:hypothetical protein
LFWYYLLRLEIQLTTRLFRCRRPCLEKTFWFAPSLGSLVDAIGISAVDISLKDQLVKVDATSASYEDVENAIKKTGKVIKSGKVVKGGVAESAPKVGNVVA